MTVPNASNKSGPYVLDGVATVFARTFLIVDADHLAIIRTENGVKTEITTGFIIDGVGNFTGNVTISPALTGGTVTLVRRVPNSQETDYSNQAKVAPAQVENDFDLVVMQIQDLAGQIEVIDTDACILAATAAADSAVSAEASAATVAGDVDQIITFTGAQMQTVSEFSSQAAFESYRNAFDYWRPGSLVSVGDMTFQKRASDAGTIWVRVDQEADKLINSYLEDVAGSVEPRHLASIPAMSLLGNALVRQGRPRGIPYEEFFYNIGARWYGDTASGGINFPRSGVTPNAANAMRSGRGTSSAGATTVTFHTPFAPCIPNVIITPKAIDLADTPLTATLIGAPDPTSFTFVIKNAAGTAVARDFNYFATGNGDY